MSIFLQKKWANSKRTAEENNKSNEYTFHMSILMRLQSYETTDPIQWNVYEMKQKKTVI